MKWDIEHVKYLERYKIQLTFKDGQVGVIDLQAALNGKVFAIEGY